MNIDLHINHANDYALDIGTPVYHPHVSVVNYDEAGKIRHSLNRFNVFAIFMQQEFPENLTYGIGRYNHQGGALLAVAPGQVGGKPDDGTLKQYDGWVLLFDPQFIHGSEIERRLPDYHFFSYNTNEALVLTTTEKTILAGLMTNLRTELKDHAGDDRSDSIVKDYILLILDYCNRFYARQFKEQAGPNSDILERFQQVLNNYYRDGLQEQQGLPSVKYCAGELYLSPGYFGDLVRNALGETPKEYIRNFITMRAKSLIVAGHNISQVAYELGFEYPNHFTRFFKKSTGFTPSQFLEAQKRN